MHNILVFEADRRTMNITINSFDTGLSKEQRGKLFPTISRLFPAGNNALPKQTTLIKFAKFASVGEYRSFFDSSAPAPAQTGDDLGDFWSCRTA